MSTSRWITVPLLAVAAAVFGFVGTQIVTRVFPSLEFGGPIMLVFLASGIACLAAIVHLFLRNIFIAAAVPTLFYFIPAEGRIVYYGFDAFISSFIVGAAAQIFLLSLAVGVPFYWMRRRVMPPPV